MPRLVLRLLYFMPPFSPRGIYAVADEARGLDISRYAVCVTLQEKLCGGFKRGIPLPARTQSHQNENNANPASL